MSAQGESRREDGSQKVGVEEAGKAFKSLEIYNFCKFLLFFEENFTIIGKYMNYAEVVQNIEKLGGML